MDERYLFIMCGLPFSGKTTFAKLVGKELGIQRVDLDEVKFEHGFEGISDDDMTEENWDDIFEDAYKRIEDLLKENGNVICDFSNLEKGYRDKLREIAQRNNAKPMVIYLNTPFNIIRERWLKNKETGERFDLTERVINESIEDLEIPGEDENTIVFNYELSVDDWVKIFKKIVYGR